MRRGSEPWARGTTGVLPGLSHLCPYTWRQCRGWGHAGPGGGLGVRVSPRAISEGQCGMLVLAPLTFEVFRVITNPTLVFSPQP